MQPQEGQQLLGWQPPEQGICDHVPAWCHCLSCMQVQASRASLHRLVIGRCCRVDAVQIKEDFMCAGVLVCKRSI